jgi:hypothetical protein
MDPISTFILTQVADTIIGTLVGDSTQELISKLQKSPTKKALKQALGEALTQYAESQPERKILAQPLLRRKSLLAEKDIANELAQVVKFVRAPDVVLIGKRWRDELDNPPPGRDFTSEAKLLIGYFTDELKATPTFAPVFEVASLDFLVAHTEEAVESLASIEKHLDSLISLMGSQFAPLAQGFAQAPVGIREHILDFSRYITEKTGGFVGRHFLFQEILEFIDTNPRGYFLLRGDPGIGKSAISAKLVKDHGYIHHFNIRAEGINKTSDFLQNICAQLITVYDLNYAVLPPETTQNTGFLNRLLHEVSQKIGQSGKCVIVVDALDEAEDLGSPSGANLLLLPRVLPLGIFIIATSRRETEEKMPLRIDIPEQMKRELSQDESGNKADIVEYIQGQGSNPGIQTYIHRHQIDDELFVDHLTDKAMGNFMYLFHVLPEIERGYYQDLALDQIPKGLESYYNDHWRRIRQENGLDWFEYRLPVVVALTVMKKPVSITLIMEYSYVDDRRRVKEALRDFDQFLYKVKIEYDQQLTTCYRWYHESFFDFIGSKEDVLEERVDLRKAKEKVADKMWNDWTFDAPISNPRNDQDLNSDFVRKQTATQAKKERALTQLFQQAQNIANVTLRENVQKALGDLTEERIDIGLFQLGREFETITKTYLIAAHAKGKLPWLPKNTMTPNEFNLDQMVNCLEHNNIVIDKPTLSYLRQKRNDPAHRRPTLEERRILMDNVQLPAGLYIDYIKLLDDLFKQITS